MKNKIDLENDLLRIEAVHKDESKEEKDNYMKQERHYSTYSRCFNVNGITKENISASYNNGILELKLPKDEIKISDNRCIEIQ